MYGPRVKGVVPPSAAVLVRMTPEEYAAMAQVAADENLSLGAWVRSLVRERLGITE